MKSLKINNLLVFLLLFSIVKTTAQTANTTEKLTHHMTEAEWERRDEIGKNRVITDPPTAPIINIAEFQPSQGVIVSYPFGIPLQLVVEMSNVVKVTTLINSASLQNMITSQYQNAGANMENIDFLVVATDSYWTRDYGPWFIIDGNGEFGVVDFVYNRPRPNDDAAMPQIANHFNINCFGMNVEHTGGNYMTDGYGTAASTTLTINENGMSADQLQQMASEYLGINTYHFIEDPLGDYIEHIDCWGKFLAVDKVLIGRVPTNDYRYQAFENAANFFANAATPWGYNYRVYRIDTPGGSSGHETPYTNSLIINDHVFVPQTGNSLDAAAIATYQEAMPGYTIVPIMQDYSYPWLNTDAIHCRTHEVADLGMLLIRHYPIYGEQTDYNNLIITCEITAYSGTPLVSDSVLVYYRIDGGEWQTQQLLPQCGPAHLASLPNIPQGSQVDYYIFAKDESGRREKHPYIGEYDPHTFTVRAVDCATPTGLQLTAEVDAVQLTWDAMEGATSYSIYRNDVWKANVTEPSWRDETIKFDQNYCYKLTAECPSGTSNYTDTLCITLPEPTCDAPVLFGTLTEDQTQVLLQWTRSENALSYILTKDGETWEEALTDTLYFDDYQGDEHCYGVISVCVAGTSDTSEIYCSPIDTTAITEWAGGVKIYPNPTHNQLFIKSHEPINELNIYNMMGQLVYTQKEAGTSISISVADLPKGSYLVRLSNAQQLVIQKVIIR